MKKQPWVKDNALKHGGESAVLAIKQGDDLAGLAAEAEIAVYNELATDGRASLVVRNAARLQAACDLYWNAIAKAAGEGDLATLDRYIKRFGWLAGCSLRAWAQVKEEHADTVDFIDYESAGGGDGGEKDS